MTDDRRTTVYYFRIVDGSIELAHEIHLPENDPETWTGPFPTDDDAFDAAWAFAEEQGI